MSATKMAGREGWTVLVVGALMMANIPAGASAQVMQFTHTGSGSGTLDGVPFPMTNFVITSFADTGNRQNVGGHVWFIDHTSSSISIAGLGNFDILTETRTFVNSGSEMVGFSRGGAGGYDLFQGPHDALFGSWDMLTPIGPISELGRLKQWSSYLPLINTTGGILIFNDTPGWTSATFSAIPEPATLWLLALGALALIRRRKRHAFV